MPDGPLNTDVKGDTAACRGTARWLTDLADATHAAGQSMSRSRSESEALWHGPAGEAFRSCVGPKVEDTDHMVDRANALSRGLAAFADDLDTVRARMGQAREVAAEAGLTVTATDIQPPGPGPDPGGAPEQPPAGADPGATAHYEQQMRTYSAAFSRHKHQVEVFEEVSTTVKEAREREQDAHRALREVIEQPSFFKKYGLVVASAVASTGAAVQGEVRRLNEKIGRYNQVIESTKDDVTSASSFGERKVFTDRLAALRKSLYDVGKQAMRSKMVSYPMGGPLTKLSPGDIESGAEKVTRLGRYGRFFPYAGTGLTVYAVGRNIADGKPAAKEIEKATGGTLASIGTGAAAGACIGGPVGAAVGALGGAAVSYGIGKFVDWKGGPVEKFNRWIGIE